MRRVELGTNPSDLTRDDDLFLIQSTILPKFIDRHLESMNLVL